MKSSLVKCISAFYRYDENSKPVDVTSNCTSVIDGAIYTACKIGHENGVPIGTMNDIVVEMVSKLRTDDDEALRWEVFPGGTIDPDASPQTLASLTPPVAFGLNSLVSVVYAYFEELAFDPTPRASFLDRMVEATLSYVINDESEASANEECSCPICSHERRILEGIAASITMGATRRSQRAKSILGF